MRKAFVIVYMILIFIPMLFLIGASILGQGCELLGWKLLNIRDRIHG